MSHYNQLYAGTINQKGSGVSDIYVYRGPVHRQHGGGIGSFLLSSFNALKPLFYRGINVLADEGIKSSKAVLSQLGKKDLPSILNEERQRVLDNLKERAINKLNHMSGKINNKQTGSGIRGRKKSIKRITKVLNPSIIKVGKVGNTSRNSMKPKQIGKGKSCGKKKKSQKGGGGSGSGKKKCCQSGKGRKRKNTKKKSKRNLDIFDISFGKKTTKKKK